MGSHCDPIHGSGGGPKSNKIRAPLRITGQIRQDLAAREDGERWAAHRSHTTVVPLSSWRLISALRTSRAHRRDNGWRGRAQRVRDCTHDCSHRLAMKSRCSALSSISVAQARYLRQARIDVRSGRFGAAAAGVSRCGQRWASSNSEGCERTGCGCGRGAHELIILPMAVLRSGKR